MHSDHIKPDMQKQNNNRTLRDQTSEAVGGIENCYRYQIFSVASDIVGAYCVSILLKYMWFL